MQIVKNWASVSTNWLSSKTHRTGFNKLEWFSLMDAVRKRCLCRIADEWKNIAIERKREKKLRRWNRVLSRNEGSMDFWDRRNNLNYPFLGTKLKVNDSSGE